MKDNDQIANLFYVVVQAINASVDHLTPSTLAMHFPLKVVNQLAQVKILPSAVAQAR